MYACTYKIFPYVFLLINESAQQKRKKKFREVETKAKETKVSSAKAKINKRECTRLADALLTSLHIFL